MDRLCGRCGGRPLHHHGDDRGCWCDACMKRERDGKVRCPFYLDPSAAPTEERRLPPERAERVGPPVGMHHPPTSHEAASSVAAGFETRKEQVLRVIRDAAQQGATDDEIEVTLGCTHQGASAARNALMREGMVLATVRKRRTRHGRMATVWVVAT